MSLGTFVSVEDYMNVYKLETFINNEHHENIINMSLGIFIYIEHYMNIINMFWNITWRRIWKHLSMKSTWDIWNAMNMFSLEHYISNVSNI